MSAGDKENKPEAKYANFFKVGYNAYEVIIDFGQYYSGQKEQVSTRIVTSPAYAKTLLQTLGDALQKYDKAFNPIKKK